MQQQSKIVVEEERDVPAAAAYEISARRKHQRPDRLLLAGAFMLGYGLLKLRADGLFVYFNSRGLPHYPGGVIALGIFLIVIAFVPIGKWVKRLACTKPRRKIRSRRFTKL